ncbi:MAG: BamA/TamA family outer membrane protein [Parvularculaceae bacterium]
MDRTSKSCAAAAAAALLAVISSARAAENYEVVYDGAPGDLAGKFKSLTHLSLEKRPYATAASIRHVADEDVEIVRKALLAAGYYSARVDFQLDRGPNDSAKLKAIFEITPGELFTINKHVIVYDDNDIGVEVRPSTFEEAGISVTDNSDGATLQKNQQAFLQHLLTNGYPTAQIVARRADARIEDGTAIAVYTFNSGPRALFDGVVVKGADRTKTDFLTKLKTWENGEPFDRTKLVAYRDRLAGTGIFSTIKIDPGTISENGTAPVSVTVDERKRRTIGAGLSYSTSEGPGARLFLEYRNILGRGEKARIELDGTQISQSINLALNKPMPGLPGSIYGNLSFTNETTDAFNARTFNLGAGLSKKWLDDRLETRGGLALETTRVDPSLAPTATIRQERNYFVSAPLAAIWSTEKDPLALNRGERISLSITPYTGSNNFVQFDANARSRLNFGVNDIFTLAGRARVTGTAGISLNALPVNKRVFSGGGSSVRGYDYQAVGPLDANGVPIGGRSAVEFALEARAKVYGPFQIAAFSDAGAVYDQPFPNFTGDYLVGAGLGVRYFSPIGPIRLDFAIPLEKRPTDRSFQIYISLGQPF